MQKCGLICCLFVKKSPYRKLFYLHVNWDLPTGSETASYASIIMKSTRQTNIAHLFIIIIFMALVYILLVIFFSQVSNIRLNVTEPHNQYSRFYLLQPRSCAMCISAYEALYQKWENIFHLQNLPPISPRQAVRICIKMFFQTRRRNSLTAAVF
jgi:hypothetical protein